MEIDEVIDRLYGLPPEEFTPARDEAERELRRAGRWEQADPVEALRKPSAAAGAVNRLVRGHRPQVEAILEAAARLRERGLWRLRRPAGRAALGMPRVRSALWWSCGGNDARVAGRLERVHEVADNPVDAVRLARR